MRAWLLGASLALASVGCDPYGTILARNVGYLLREPAPVVARHRRFERSAGRLAVTWVGHATTIVQLDDRLVITDPVLGDTVGQLSRRMVEPGLDVDALPHFDLALVSHLHVDHLHYGSLDRLEGHLGKLLVPRGGLVYVPSFAFPAEEAATWERIEFGGVAATATPVRHSGYRYGADAAWMKRGFTGWVIQRGDLTVYFGGDTAYDRAAFRETARRFPRIDVAILPIGPIEPHELARKNHLDGREAVAAFRDLGARFMVPMHFDTFPHGTDGVGDAVALLREAATREGLAPEAVRVLRVGETFVAR